MIGWALFDFARALRRLPSDAEERWVLHAAIAVIVSVLVSGFYSWNLNNSEVLAMFLAVMGCGYVAMWQAEAKTGEQSYSRGSFCTASLKCSMLSSPIQVPVIG